MHIYYTCIFLWVCFSCLFCSALKYFWTEGTFDNTSSNFFSHYGFTEELMENGPFEEGKVDVCLYLLAWLVTQEWVCFMSRDLPVPVLLISDIGNKCDSSG